MKGLALILTVAAFCYEPAPQKSQETLDKCCEHCYHVENDKEAPAADKQETLEEEDDEPARQ